MNSYILGVFNKETERYENIIHVDKKNQYKCIGCSSDLILRKGEKNFQSFIHKNKNGCQYFKNPSEEVLLNDASLHLKELLNQQKVNIFRRCEICKFKFNMNLITENINNIIINSSNNTIYAYDENENLIYNFKMNNCNKYDNLLDDNCYQINMLGLIERIVTNFASQKVELLCSKSIICSECNRKYC